ncbi:xanthine dehydrogenase family protein molybdopterin-binding subunit [Robertkochia solimangrovi]|nr:xanthine dehydrogenase family protein molybdopterin-binding subunit [Robertkochia solimangrovi]
MGSVSIGFSLFGSLSCLTENEKELAMVFEHTPKNERIDSWLQVLEDGSIEIYTGKMELGQGISIAIMQVAAEELNIPVSRIAIHLAETGITPDEGITAGSRSIETSAMSVRQAAACAREILMEIAGTSMKLPVNELVLEDGQIRGREEVKNFHELLQGNQIERAAYEPKEYYGKTQRNIVGKPVKRPDLEKMVRGETFYIHDMRFPEMVHARVVRPPVYGAVLQSIRQEELDLEPGFLKLVRSGSFLGIITEGEYQAVQLQQKMTDRCKWYVTKELPQYENLTNYIKSLPADTQTDVENGNLAEAQQNAQITHKAVYSKPWIMHGSNGPSCAIALFDKEKLHIWCHSQGVYPLRETIAKMLNIPVTDIHIKGVPGSGCYGHNPADDVAAEAAIMAMEFPGRHIRLQWMRQEEHAWEPYGTAMLMEHKATLDSTGKITSWNYELWSDTHSTRPANGDPANLLPGRYLDKGFEAPQGGGWRGGTIRNAEPLYSLDNFKLTSHSFSGPLRVSALRSLGAYANIYGIECFMNELAAKAKADPFEFRIRHLNDERAINCLKELQRMTTAVNPESGEGFGIGFARYKNSASYCAVAALVGFSENKPAIKHMWGVIEAGECINSDGLKNQTEGGMIQSASWTLMEQVTFDREHITSTDWYSYPMLRYPEIPKIEVTVIDRPDLPPSGAGESAQGPTAAAVTNALFKATGSRIRDLPLSK